MPIQMKCTKNRSIEQNIVTLYLFRNVQVSTNEITYWIMIYYYQKYVYITGKQV